MMDNKQFEKNAHALLKYGIGHSIEEAREKLRALIKANRITEKSKKIEENDKGGK